MDKPGWDIKVTSKGQITIPKQARDIMMVREGDQLQAVLSDDSLVLTRKVDLNDSEQMKLALREVLRGLGYADGQTKQVPDRRKLRESIGPVPDLTRLVREGREKP